MGTARSARIADSVRKALLAALRVGPPVAIAVDLAVGCSSSTCATIEPFESGPGAGEVGIGYAGGSTGGVSIRGTGGTSRGGTGGAKADASEPSDSGSDDASAGDTKSDASTDASLPSDAGKG